MGSRIDENAHAPSAPALDSSDVNVPVDGPSRALAPASPDAADVRRSGSAHVLTHVLTSPTRSVPSGDGAGTASLWPRLSPDERPLSPLNPKSDRGRATKAPAVVEAPVDDDKRESKHVSKPFTPTQCLLGISFLSLCWMLVTAFALAPLGANSGPTGAACVGTPTEGTLCLCPRPTVCATEWHEVVFLAFARASAYFDYPMYMLLFLTKCHNLCGAAYRTYLKEWLPLDDAHHLHTFAGTFVACEVVWHSSWHVARWACGGDLRFLWEHRTGVTGAVALLVTPLIAVPMMFEKARKRVPYEYRKTMHYLSVVWGIAVAFHAPATNVFWVVGVCVCLYLGDWLVGYFLCIRYCPTLKMTRLGETAVEVVFQHPKGFVNHGGNYVYLCLPWLGKAEWHAFSLYAHPTLENHSSVCVAKLGDWTGALHRALSKPSAKPGWVYGPFPSPFSAATDSDNLVSVASGIGVTPTLGTIKLLSSSRTVNVVWMCRDADLVEYFLRTVTFDLDAWSLIYYTGKRKLVLSEDQFRANPKLLLIQGRPDIRRVVLDIVRACETDGELNRDTVDAAHAMVRAFPNPNPSSLFGPITGDCLLTHMARKTDTFFYSS
jgi:predicted ferric reductase